MLFGLCVYVLVGGWVKGRGIRAKYRVFVVHYYIYVTLRNDVYN